MERALISYILVCVCVCVCQSTHGLTSTLPKEWPCGCVSCSGHQGAAERPGRHPSRPLVRGERLPVNVSEALLTVGLLFLTQTGWCLRCICNLYTVATFTFGVEVLIYLLKDLRLVLVGSGYLIGSRVIMRSGVLVGSGHGSIRGHGKVRGCYWFLVLKVIIECVVYNF